MVGAEFAVLEIKRTSITRLKRRLAGSPLGVRCCLKSKEPRLRDWNYLCAGLSVRYYEWAWNQKNLDYEIETADNTVHCRYRQQLEIKRTSITRLKPWFCWSTNVLPCAWNQKNLDYEIETLLIRRKHLRVAILEIKRTSITRLKPKNGGASWGAIKNLKSKEPRLRDWNLVTEWASCRFTTAWNQKNLDYEIETGYARPETVIHQRLEIKRTSITRLKPLSGSPSSMSPWSL